MTHRSETQKPLTWTVDHNGPGTTRYYRATDKSTGTRFEHSGSLSIAAVRTPDEQRRHLSALFCVRLSLLNLAQEVALS